MRIVAAGANTKPVFLARCARAVVRASLSGAEQRQRELQVERGTTLSACNASRT